MLQLYYIALQFTIKLKNMLLAALSFKVIQQWAQTGFYPGLLMLNSMTTGFCFGNSIMSLITGFSPGFSMMSTMTGFYPSHSMMSSKTGFATAIFTEKPAKTVHIYFLFYQIKSKSIADYHPRDPRRIYLCWVWWYNVLNYRKISWTYIHTYKHT